MMKLTVTMFGALVLAACSGGDGQRSRSPEGTAASGSCCDQHGAKGDACCDHGDKAAGDAKGACCEAGAKDAGKKDSCCSGGSEAPAKVPGG